MDHTRRTPLHHRTHHLPHLTRAAKRTGPAHASWTEISGVCTDDEWRGHGFATRLMRMLAGGIRARGETPFLHALASNTDAVRLYETMGFRLRRTITFTAARVPEER